MMESIFLPLFIKSLSIVLGIGSGLLAVLMVTAIVATIFNIVNKKING